MRLLSRALRAAQGYRAAALPPRSLRAAPVGWRLPARRGLSARPGLEELFAAPSLRRLLEARARGEGGAAPQLAARVQRLRDKERELRDTRELARDENEDFRKLAETEIASCEEEIAELKQQIGTKGRSEKIRTYNFPQDRITDHRISRSVHHVESFMLGEEMLDEMIQTLREYADYESLMEIISENDKNNS